MLKRLAFIIPLLLVLSSCGPIIGQMMKISEGVKDFKLVSGDLKSLSQKGLNILAVGPFDKTPDAYYIARGDEAGMFFQEFNNNGHFKSELHIGRRYGDLQEAAAKIRSKSAAQLKSDFGLKAEPDLVMFGTVLDRQTIVAPTRGIIMQVSYRLEFFNTASKASTVIEITVKDHFKDCVKMVISEIISQAEATRAR